MVLDITAHPIPNEDLLEKCHVFYVHTIKNPISPWLAKLLLERFSALIIAASITATSNIHRLYFLVLNICMVNVTMLFAVQAIQDQMVG
jgi:hypothetical protein